MVWSANRREIEGDISSDLKDKMMWLGRVGESMSITLAWY